MARTIPSSTHLEAPSRPIDALLRLVTALMAGTAAWTAATQPSTVNAWLFLSWGVPEEVAAWVDRGAAFTLVLAGLTALFRPGALCCLPIAAWLALEALARLLIGGEPFAQLAPFGHAVRFAAPLALWLWSAGRRDAAFELARVAAAATFLAHGYEALQHHPRFIDLLIPAAREHLGWRMSEATARHILTAIGLQDVLLALALGWRRARGIAFYMAAWGAITLGARVLAWGLEQWPAAAIRCANLGLPLFLGLAWPLRWRPGPNPTPTNSES